MRPRRSKFKLPPRKPVEPAPIESGYPITVAAFVIGLVAFLQFLSFPPLAIPFAIGAYAILIWAKKHETPNKLFGITAVGSVIIIVFGILSAFYYTMRFILHLIVSPLV